MNDICKLKQIEEKLCVQCLICGEPVELDEMESFAILHPHTTFVKVCKECRNAVKFAKSAMMKQE